MWLASYVVHLRRVHWRAGADWLVAHLLDGDLASNHLSWQWVAGTASRKPYLFNADNVARYAPADWHSAGTAVDRSYEALDAIARDARASAAAEPAASNRDATPEPALQAAPPADLGVGAPDAAAAERLRGRDVWLVHPWALRAVPAGLPEDAAVVGVYPREHHATWPWPEARWRWVDAAMRAVTQERWMCDVDELVRALAGAARVRGVDDPHVTRLLSRVARLEPAPRLFPIVERPCGSFSQWWTRATRGLRSAEALL